MEIDLNARNLKICLGKCPLLFWIFPFINIMYQICLGSHLYHSKMFYKVFSIKVYLIFVILLEALFCLWLLWLFYWILWVFKKFFLMFISFWDRERQSVSWGRGRKRVRHRIWSRLQTLSYEHRARHRARTHKPWDVTWAEVGRLTNWASQPPRWISCFQISYCWFVEKTFNFYMNLSYKIRISRPNC